MKHYDSLVSVAGSVSNRVGKWEEWEKSPALKASEERLKGEAMKPRLTNVSIVSTDSPFTAPECRSMHLRGNVFGHPSFADGELVTTSRIIDMEWSEGWAQTLNTEYKIVSLDKKFIEFCEGLEHKGRGTLEFLDAVKYYTGEKEEQLGLYF